MSKPKRPARMRAHATKRRPDTKRKVGTVQGNYTMRGPVRAALLAQAQREGVAPHETLERALLAYFAENGSTEVWKILSQA
jgi:hypothetical protein